MVRERNSLESYDNGPSPLCCQAKGPAGRVPGGAEGRPFSFHACERMGDDVVIRVKSIAKLTERSESTGSSPVQTTNPEEA